MLSQISTEVKIMILLLVVVIVAGLYALNFTGSDKKLPNKPTYKTLSEQVKGIKDPKVIAYNDNFEIDYAPDYKIYSVIINATTLEEYRSVKASVERYFISLKADICKLKITYVPPQPLSNQVKVEDTVSSNCS